MTDLRIENLHISAEEKIITPENLKRALPLTEKIVQTVLNGQNTVRNILFGRDRRILAVVGPCSIHDIDAANEYAARLKNLADQLQEKLFIIMRIYFEKPRTTTGWQGFLADPNLDGSNQIEEGLKRARQFLLFLGELGLPAAGEALDIVTPQYIQDLFSWTAIGARTTESQSHRKMASGLSTVVGFKNSTQGDIDIAVNAVKAAAKPHNFISVDPTGQVAVIRTKGNPYTHLILRGGRQPNYQEDKILQYEKRLIGAGLNPVLMIDCSHGNSSKNPDNQINVLHNIARQLSSGNNSIRGIMLESNLFGGRQNLHDPSELKYGVSITDACIGWEDTEKALRELADYL